MLNSYSACVVHDLSNVANNVAIILGRYETLWSKCQVFKRQFDSIVKHIPPLLSCSAFCEFLRLFVCWITLYRSRIIVARAAVLNRWVATPAGDRLRVV